MGVGLVSKKKNFSAHRASVWAKNKGGAHPLDLLLPSAVCLHYHCSDPSAIT